MAKKDKSDNDTNLLRRALRIAAIEAYQTEVTAAGTENMIGSTAKFPTVKDWLDDRIETWIQQAELKT